MITIYVVYAPEQDLIIECACTSILINGTYQNMYSTKTDTWTKVLILGAL